MVRNRGKEKRAGKMIPYLKFNKKGGGGGGGSVMKGEGILGSTMSSLKNKNRGDGVYQMMIYLCKRLRNVVNEYGHTNLSLVQLKYEPHGCMASLWFPVHVWF